LSFTNQSLVLGYVLRILALKPIPKLSKKILLPPWIVKGQLLLEIIPFFNLRLMTLVRNGEFRREIPKTTFQEEALIVPKTFRPPFQFTSFTFTVHQWFAWEVED